MKISIKELFNRALFYISVPKCVLCREKLDYEDRGLCKACQDVYTEHKKRNCPNCSNVLSKCLCTYDTLAKNGVKRLAKLFRYSHTDESLPSNYLIYSLKQDNRDDVVSFLADELSEPLRIAMNKEPGDYIVTNVPRREKAIVNFGYDHAAELAKAVAKRLNIEYTELLRSRSKRAQKTVFGQERIENAKFDYKHKKHANLKGKRVILIDDIITTGSSMSNSARLIKKLGPKEIVGACLGTAYKEKYIDFENSAYE